MSDRPGCAVLIEDPAALQPQAIAKVIGEWKKMPFQDAIRIAKNCWGFVMDGLTAPEAEDLMVRLNAAGLKSYVTKPEYYADVPKLGPKPLKKAVVAAAGLVLPYVEGDPGIHEYRDPAAPKTDETLSWERLELVAAAGVNVTEYSKIKVKEGPSAGDRAISMGIMLTTGLPIKVGKKERVVEQTVENNELMFFLDLVFKEPALRLRVDAQNFDFSWLKERKVYNVLGNFKLLLGDLKKTAPGARFNVGARVLLENKPVREMGYLTIEDLDRETRWLLTLAHRTSA